MMRRLVRWCLLGSACVAAACGGEPKVVLNVSGDGGEALVRLRVVVRECGETQLASLFDLDTSKPAPEEPFEAAVAPGKIFYVWVQAWGTCTVDPSGCPDAESAAPGTCLCIEGETSGQKQNAEACSTWLQAKEGVTEVPLRLGPLQGTCPPETLDPCTLE